MPGPRFTMSRDRLAELRGNAGQEKRYDRLSDDYDEPPPVPNLPRGQAAGQPSPRYNDDYSYRPPVEPSPTYTKSTTKEQYEMTERKVSPVDLGDTENFFREIEDVKELIRRINLNISDIEELHGSSLINISDEQMAENTRRLELLSSETTKLNNEAKKKIKAVELSNAQLPDSGDKPMRVTQHAALKKRFIETIQRYQDIERTYQQKYRQRVERQIRIVKPDATPDEIEQVLDSDEAPQIFAQSLMQANRSGHAKAVLSEVQTRHDDIKKIEKTILELHQLFMDMQMMIEQQGETLNKVEMATETTVVDLEQGNKEIGKAINYAKATRAKKWCCFVIAIIILVVVAILVWWFAFDHPGVN